MKVYKVVREHEGKLYSAVINNIDLDYFYGSFERVYAVGKKTLPPKKYPKAWLAAFTSLSHAEHFCRNEYGTKGLVIYEAEASETCQGTLTTGLKGCIDLVCHWANISPHAWSGPPGTILCSDITLIRRVWPDEALIKNLN